MSEADNIPLPVAASKSASSFTLNLTFVAPQSFSTHRSFIHFT